MIPLFDAHCDTAFELLEKQLPLRKNGLHVDIDRCGKYAPSARVFAIWGRPEFAEGEPDFCDLYRAIYDNLIRELEENSDAVRLCTAPGDIDRAEGEGRLAAIISVEGAELLGCEPSRLEDAHKQGVRMVSLTWNMRNQLASSHCDRPELGLTELGAEFVSEAQRLGIALDVSHISEEAFWDIIAIAERPVVASHSNSRALCGHSRNLSDEQLRAIAQTGGAVGINLYTEFLGEGRVDLDCVCRHMEHILKLGGEKALAIGGDLDGCDSLPSGFCGVEDYAALYDMVCTRFGRETADDIFYNNLKRVVIDLCGI